MKYFVVNKELDFKRGYLEGAEFSQGSLRLLPGETRGVFISRIFDGREQDLAWHRFCLNGRGPGGASLYYSFYCTDSLEFADGGMNYRIPELLRDREVALERKKELLRPFLRKEAAFPEDILLHELRGRYLFFMAELAAQGGEGPEVRDMIVYFPREDWLAYLPGLYRREKNGAGFTARYLGIFQSLYDDLSRRICTGSRLMDPADTDMEWLKELAGWLQLEDFYIWPEDRLRRLLQMAPRLFAETGTVRGMMDLVELYTGERPLIAECGPLSDMDGAERAEKLYGNDPYSFVLLVKEQYVATARDYQALKCIIRQMKPAHMEVRVIPLKPVLSLGTYSYLGINSRIGMYQPLRLNGRQALTVMSVGGQDR